LGHTFCHKADFQSHCDTNPNSLGALFIYFLPLLQGEKLRHAFCYKVIVPTLCAQIRTRFHLEGRNKKYIDFNLEVGIENNIEIQKNTNAYE